MRQLVTFSISLLLLIGSLVAVFGTISIRDFELRGYVNPTADPNLPFAAPRPGVNADLRQYSRQELEAHLELMQDSHFVWIRQFAYWDEIEPQPGEYDWSAWDVIADAMRNYPQLELVAVLMNTPEWARVSGADTALTRTAPPRSLADFAAFARAFAARYGDVIDYYQIWDEPNLDDAWGLLPPRPADYTALLAAAYQAIHAADPGADVIAAALAPTTEIAGQNISDIRFLQAMYQHGAREFMDAVAAKPYGFSSSAMDRTVDETMLNFSRIIALREVMTASDDAKTALWASHWGWNALPADWSGDDSIWGQVTAEEQIAFTLSAFDRASREWPWLGAMILHHWQPDAEADSAQWGFALVQPNGEPSGLLQAIQNRPFPSQAQNGLHHPRTPFARYSGLWEFSELGADIGWLETSDSQLEFEFFGADLSMLLREDDYVAFLYPTIDGQPANATPHDSSGNAYVFLRSDSHRPETNLVSISTRLPLARHTLRIVADRGWNRWAIAGFAVSSGDLSAGYHRQIVIGAIATCLSFIVFMYSFVTAPWKTWLPAAAVFVKRLSVTSQLVFSGITSAAMMIAMLWTWASERPTILLRGEPNILLALVTGGLLYLSPSFIISILAGLALFVLIYHRLETGLILTLLWAPFFLFPIELYSFAFPMAEVMILLTALAGFLKLMVGLGVQIQMSNSAWPLVSKTLFTKLRMMDAAVIGIAIMAAMSLVWTRQMDAAMTELRTLILEPTLFYCLFRAIRPTKESLIRFVDALMIAGLLVSVLGLLAYMQGDAIITAEGGARRLASVYGSPNNVALLLGRTMPFALAFLLVKTDRRRRAFAAAALFFMGIALVLTQSVGALILGIPASAIVILFGRYRRQAILSVGAVGVIAAAGFAMLSQVSARFANILDFTTGTNFFRLRLWESAVEIIRDHPITGIGLDQFLYRFSGEYVRPDAVWDPDLSHPHNVILDFWTRLGIIGVFLFAAIQISFWRSVVAALNLFRQQDRTLFALALGLMGSMAGLLAHGFIDNSVFVIDLAFIFMFQLAAAVRLNDIANSRESTAQIQK